MIIKIKVILSPAEVSISVQQKFTGFKTVPKAVKGFFQEKEVTDSVPSILSAVLIIGKHGKPIESSVILTLSEDKLCS